VDPATPDVRTHFDDHRETAALKAAAPAISAARTRTADGYVVEALLPWSNLQIRPAAGREIAFQIVVNDVDGESSRVQQMWYPEEGAYSDPAKMHRVRLSDKPSPPVLVAALADTRAFPRTRLRIVAPETAGMAGKKVTAAGRSATLTAENGWTAGTISLPPHTTGLVTLTADGKPVGAVATGDARRLRQQALASATLVFQPHVFSGESFPACDFREPSRVEDLIGPYTLEPAFYDANFARVTKATAPGRYGAIVTVRGEDGTTFKRHLTLYRAARPSRLVERPHSRRPREDRRSRPRWASTRR
jgi:hypothetical protein